MSARLEILENMLGAAKREFDQAMAGIGGCGNHGCLVKKVVGMGTNAGCRCWQDKITSQRVMRAARRLRDGLGTVETEFQKELREAVRHGPGSS